MKIDTYNCSDGCRIYLLPSIRIEYPGDDYYYCLEFLFLKFCIGIRFATTKGRF